MEIVYTREELTNYMARAIEASPDRPVLVDRFLMHAVEIDVDAVADGKEVYIGGIMEHIEYAGVHSGDSACRIPPANLLPETVEKIKAQTTEIALELSVCGLINIQFAVVKEGNGSERREEVYVLEVNPRASRTVPYVSKATGIPMAKVAARCMVGKTLAEQGVQGCFEIDHVAVKEAVLPFVKFRNVDPVLGPEMRSTGEVMGLAADFGTAYAKSQAAAGTALPQVGSGLAVFISVSRVDREGLADLARSLQELGFRLVATGGTRGWLGDHGIDSDFVFKIDQGRPNILDRMKNGEIGLVINTPGRGGEAQRDEFQIRRLAVETGIAYITTLSAARAAVEALRSGQGVTEVKSLQEYHLPGPE
jgi:carbamoyl-phosphate synthase large subunit